MIVIFTKLYVAIINSYIVSCIGIRHATVELQRSARCTAVGWIKIEKFLSTKRGVG
jgi:hypothetical protein